MEIILAVYLVVAGVLASGHKEGIIEDNTTKSTYEFEAMAAENNGDVLKAAYLNGRLEEWEKN